jgi:hypothetical protein
MTATMESIVEAARALSSTERFDVANALWEMGDSPPFSFADEAIDDVLATRDAEMDSHPEASMTQEQFLAAFAHRRKA